MEHTRVEVAVVEQTIQEVLGEQILQLSELQLALVGGGIADVIAG